MKNYFDALDRLCESGQPSTSEAISALQGKFPELSANAERAGRIVTAWRAGFGKTHVPQEGYASSEEAEALFLFGDFLRDLASNLACRNSAEKCALCVFTNTPACERMAPPCYNGVEQYLLKRAAAYHQKMEVCCKAYFAYLDELQKQGGYSQYEAEDALKAEFPWLSSHEEYAKYAIASWIHKYWA